MPAEDTPNLMEEAMRWFGPADTVTLSEIGQTGATAIFSALHEIPYGEAWPAEMIEQRKAEIAAAGLIWRVVESVPVHEAIKMVAARLPHSDASRVATAPRCPS